MHFDQLLGKDKITFSISYFFVIFASYPFCFRSGLPDDKMVSILSRFKPNILKRSISKNSNHQRIETSPLLFISPCSDKHQDKHSQSNQFLANQMFPNLFHSFTPNSQNSMQFSAFLWPSSSPINVGSHHKRRPTQFPVGNKWNLVFAAIISSVLPDFVKIVNVIVQFSSTNTHNHWRWRPFPSNI